MYKNHAQLPVSGLPGFRILFAMTGVGPSPWGAGSYSLSQSCSRASHTIPLRAMGNTIGTHLPYSGKNQKLGNSRVVTIVGYTMHSCLTWASSLSNYYKCLNMMVNFNSIVCNFMVCIFRERF